MFKMQSNIENLESLINYSFNDRELLFLSLTHPSFANENNIDKCHTNQRLEFLGDAVLELISSDFLYKLFDNYSEGLLTKTRALLVCEKNLASVARQIQIYNYLLIGKGENRQNLMNNDSTMCDAIEALIGAIYLDGGLDSAKTFINSFVLTEENLNKSSNDYKSKLQEKVNAINKRLIYEVIKETGPDHDKKFEVRALIDDKVYGIGVGRSKKEAEQDAARQALGKL